MAEAEYQLSLPARSETDDDSAIATTLAKVKDRLGTIPNLYGRMANVPGLSETYRTGYEASGTTPGSAQPSRRPSCWPSAAPTAAPTASPPTASSQTLPTCRPP